MSTSDLLSRLDKVKRTRPGNWLARCPAHADKHPSLSVREKSNGQTLVKCFAGCSVEEIVGAVGLEMSSLFPERLIDDRVRPERPPFNAHDVLACLSDESFIVSVAASNLARGMSLTKEDRARLWLAANRIEEGRRLANGER